MNDKDVCKENCDKCAYIAEVTHRAEKAEAKVKKLEHNCGIAAIKLSEAVERLSRLSSAVDVLVALLELGEKSEQSK